MTTEIKPGYVGIKNSDILVGLMERRFSPLLVTIVTYILKTYGGVITESYRYRLHPGDLHSTQPVRAVDLRSHCYPNGLAGNIANDVNSKWCYDPQRPEKLVALLHSVKGGAFHFHIQVHPNTVRRSNG